MARKSNSYCAAALRLAVLLLCILPLAGCWTVKQEVISADEGEAIPLNINFQYMGNDDHSPLYLTRPGNNNDYQFQLKNSDGSITEGTFRAINVKDNIYAVQIRCKGSDDIDIRFYSISSEDWKVVVPAVDLTERFASYGITVDGDDMSGDPSNINRFLRSLSDIDFKDE